MDLRDAALVIAGTVGSTGAIVHGVPTQRLMVRPIHDLAAGKRESSPVRSEGWCGAIALYDVQLVHQWDPGPPCGMRPLCRCGPPYPLWSRQAGRLRHEDATAKAVGLALRSGFMDLRRLS
jgi:hypothetical protein